MKERLDVLLVSRGLAPSREKAKAVIMAGLVYVDGQKEDKAGSTFDAEEANVEVRGNTLPYVSRGGLKLERAVEVFNLDLTGRICMDIGASTGGFTDCMLQNGASKVYSIDVGHGQLDWKLRNDERVVCMEKTNFRYLEPSSIPDTVNFASCDVSFISLDKILPVAFGILSDDATMVTLIKPQFEAGREKVGKKGVVRDPAVHREVIERIIEVAKDTGFSIIDLNYSPIRGPEGNIEYLLYLAKPGTDITPHDTDIAATVAAAHEKLDHPTE
jgi:23S rRNA (cytidine1920-2'-O)/16S rRNA (cytidine1409-2'-O)-methyltransferase